MRKGLVYSLNRENMGSSMTTDNKMRALVYRPARSETKDDELIEVIEYDNSDYKNLYPLIECNMVTAVYYLNNVLYLDDEGLLSSGNIYVTEFDFYPTPLAGNIVVLGAGTNGENVATDLTPAALYKTIKSIAIYNNGAET